MQSWFPNHMKSERTKGACEAVACPYCGGHDFTAWADERGFTAVRCNICALVYVNPRPTLDSIDAAVRTGAHSDAVAQGMSVVSRRVASKVARYEKIFARLFADVWRGGKPVSWLDVGAGYGEVVEAVTRLAPAGSRIEGLEPMRPKATQARARGLAITEGYLRASHAKVGFVSVVDVFSHIPNFGDFLSDVTSVLEPGGEIFIETGNLADLERREDFAGELGLPNHLVFAGECHLRGYLERAGFEIVQIEATRIDDVTNLLKNVVKKLLGRPVILGRPYSSNYRQLLARARLRQRVQSSTSLQLTERLVERIVDQG